jgi:hypothetical protein
MLSPPASLHCTTLQRNTKNKEKKGDDIVVVVTFFVVLHNKKHKEEEGDGIVAVAFFVELERSSTTGRRNKKKKVRCLPGSRFCSRVGPVPASTALLLEAPFQDPAPSSPLQARSRSTSLELWRWSKGGRGW